MLSGSDISEYNKGSWSECEDMALSAGLHEFGWGNWKAIATKHVTSRSSVQVS